MTLAITDIRSATDQEWDFHWRRCDCATYFQSQEWAQVWQQYTAGKIYPEPKRIIFNDGKEALLPLSVEVTCKGLVRTYVTSPMGTFGGWISQDELTVEHAEKLAEYLSELGNLVWRINPYDDVLRQIQIENAREDVTHALDLRDGIEAIWEKGRKRKVKKAKREGVSVRTSAQLEDWSTYFAMYEDSLRRWGDRATSRYEWELFETLFRRNSAHILLWLAYYQEDVVAGALCFSSKRHVVYWHGAALKEYFPLRPVNLLMYEIIRAAAQQGYWWFDFNPSGGHEGVAAFKKSFGAQEYASPMVVKTKATTKALHKIRGLVPC